MKSRGQQCEGENDQYAPRDEVCHDRGFHAITLCPLCLDLKCCNQAIALKTQRSSFHRRKNQNAQPLGWALSIAAEILSVILAALVAGDHAVFNMDYAMGIFRDVVLVRDENDGVAFGLEPVKQGHDLHARL